MWVFLSGMVFAAVGVWGMYRDWRLNRAGERVPGVVVDLRWESGVGNSDMCYLVIEFRTVDCRVIQTSTRIGSGSPMAGLGDRVDVLYDPNKPERVSINTWSGRERVLTAPERMYRSPIRATISDASLPRLPDAG